MALDAMAYVDIVEIKTAATIQMEHVSPDVTLVTMEICARQVELAI